MKTFDCFTYFNEEKILKVRLNEMYDAVDKFIIVEGSKTFTGKHKPYYFDHILDWIKPFKDKIEIYRIDFPADDMTTWEREFFQRNQIFPALKKFGAQRGDRIIISDADEIIRSSFLKKNTPIKEPVRLDVVQYFWNYNWQVPHHCNQGARPILCMFEHLDIHSPQELRSISLEVIENCGWHFSFFAEEEKIKNKIESFAHSEYNLDEYKSYDKILNRIMTGVDPFDRFPLKSSLIDSSYPECVFLDKC